MKHKSINMNRELQELRHASRFKLYVSSPGFAALTTLIFVVSISSIIISSFAFVSLREVRIARAYSNSIRSYYTAEAGIEDAVYRFVTGREIENGETIAVGNATGTISIVTLGSKKTITVEAISNSSIYRTVQSVIQIEGTPVGFSYGVQVGNGGFELGDNSSIIGNVYSNGTITGAGKTKSTITGTAQSAATIQDIRVEGSGYANILDDCYVGGTAYYKTSITGCTATSTTVLSQAPAAQPFPVSAAQIAEWKDDAEAGGTQGGLTMGNNANLTLGPKKIAGNLVVGNSATLTLTGTIWVTGTITLGNNAVIQLSSGYGANSGVILADGAVSTGNSASLRGTGQAGSYLLVVSLFGPTNAITIGNNATSSIFYAPNGIIDIGNGLALREVVGYGLRIGNNATITYDQGLLNSNFTSGPTASWVIQSWKEIE